jgi:hypothetical protein
VTKTRLPYGKIRRYLRRPGSKRLPLPGTPGSRQFIAAYEAGLAVSTAAQARSRDYRARLSSAFLFARLKPSPQRLYRIVLDKFREEDGHRLVCDMPRRVARRIIEEIGETRPSMARFTTTCCDRSRQPRRTGLHSLVHRMAVQ